MYSILAMASLSDFAALRLLEGADYLNTFRPDQLHSLALFAMGLHGDAYAISLVFRFRVPVARVSGLEIKLPSEGRRGATGGRGLLLPDQQLFALPGSCVRRHADASPPRNDLRRGALAHPVADREGVDAENGKKSERGTSAAELNFQPVVIKPSWDCPSSVPLFDEIGPS